MTRYLSFPPKKQHKYWTDKKRSSLKIEKPNEKQEYYTEQNFMIALCLGAGSVLWFIVRRGYCHTTESNGTVTDEWRIGKDLKGSGWDIMKALPGNLPQGTVGKNQEHAKTG